MKILFIFFIALSSTNAFAQTNTITITGSGGLHSTVTKILGSNPVIFENTQFAKNPIATTRIYKTGKKSNGIYLGLSSSGDAIKVKSAFPDNLGGFGYNSMLSGGSLARFEFGYHLIFKKIVINNILSESNKKNVGFFTQIQPLAAVSLNLSNSFGSGRIGEGPNNLVVRNYPIKKLGVLYGLNFYFGKNNKTWFFINATHNIIFAYSTSSGTFSSTLNGITTTNKVETNGSGFSFSGGLVLFKFKYRK